MEKKENRADIIIEEGSFSSEGKKGGRDGRRGRRGRRVVGLRMEQERWVRVNRRGSDVEAGGRGVEVEDVEEGGDDETIYMTRSGRRNGEMETGRGDRGEFLVVKREKVENERQREGTGSSGERRGRRNGNRGRGRRGRGQRGRVEMSGALENLDEPIIRRRE